MICSKCKEDKPEEEFVVDKRWSRGRGYFCKSCHTEYHKDYYEKNRQKFLDRTSQWVKDNPEKHRANGQKYRDNHQEEERLRANKKYKKYKYRWKIYKAKRRELEQGLDELTKELLEELFVEQEGKCFYCFISLDETYHLDHKNPLSRGGTNIKDNLALTCPNCNLKKHTKTAEEFMESKKCV